MTFGIFARGLWLQTVITLFLFIAGILFGLLLVSCGASPDSVNNASMGLQDLSASLKESVEKAVSGKNETSWVYFLFGNGLANLVVMSMFFVVATFKSFHEVAGKPGFFPSMLYRFTGWYLKIFNLTLNSSPSFLNLAMALSFPSILALGFISFSFGSFTVSAVKITGLSFYLAAILPHGIFEIPAAIVSGSLPLAMLIEIVRLKRENEDASTWQISRQIAFSRPIYLVLAAIFTATLISAIIEGHYTSMIVESFFKLPKK